MWRTKYFVNYAAQAAWMERNAYRYQITPLFVCNGYAVEYRPLVKPGMPR